MRKKEIIKMLEIDFGYTKEELKRWKDEQEENYKNKKYMSHNKKELLKAIEDNTFEVDLYEDGEMYKVIPLQYIADELEDLK